MASILPPMNELPLQSHNEIVDRLLSTPTSLDFKVRLVQNVFELLIVEAQASRTIQYLGSIKKFVETELSLPSSFSVTIQQTFAIALALPNQDRDSVVPSGHWRWSASLRHVSQHPNSAVRVATTQLIGSYYLVCASHKKTHLVTSVAQLLQYMLSDSSRIVVREVAKTFSTMLSRQRSVQGVDGPRLPLLCLRCESAMALLSFHGGRAGTRFESHQDRQVVYTVLENASISDFATFSLIVTFFQRRLYRITSVDSTNDKTELHIIKSEINHCLQSVVRHHPHFNRIYAFSQQTRD